MNCNIFLVVVYLFNVPLSDVCRVEPAIDYRGSWPSL
jgi:hypothetical protein